MRDIERVSGIVIINRNMPFLLHDERTTRLDLLERHAVRYRLMYATCQWFLKGRKIDRCAWGESSEGCQ
jgi:hypothetical protein